MSDTKRKVVVLGGGIGALSAVFELTDRPNWQEEFESITVYQMGWRLGGKGASGRNAGRGQRIEEHGLHVWPGFYDNAFEVMRRCYSELDRPESSPLAGWDDAFKRHHFIVVTEHIGGQWKHWSFEAPPKPLLPGDVTTEAGLWEYVVGGLDLMVGWFHQAVGMEEPELPPVSAPHTGAIDRLLSLLEGALRWIGLTGWGEGLRSIRSSRLLRTVIDGASELSEEVMLDVARRLAQRLDARKAVSRPEMDLLLWLTDHAISRLTSQLGDLAAISDTLRRLWIQLDFSRTMLRGVVHDVVFDNGFDALDGEDFMAWMRRHGASEITLDSALMRGLHDFVFAYEDADPQKPNLAAGVALRLILRLTLRYKGAIMWKMQGGMGDVVFAPLYEVLRRRGVEFKFFHCVRQLEVSDDGQSIGQIRFGRQATVTGGDYSPLVDVKGLPCWPNKPDYQQLHEGSDLQEQDVDLESIWADWPDVEQIVLRAGVDFDVVVLGISLAALRDTCGPLIQSNTAWHEMMEHMRTVKTRGVQLWFTPTLSGLGWPLQSPILTAYQKPLETWADMSQTLPHENWPADGTPGNVAYFCGTIPDDGPIPDPGPNPFPREETQAVHDAAVDWLRHHARPLFPAAVDAGTGELNWSELHDPGGGNGVVRFESQFWKANVEPTDRYVQSLAGTTQFRLHPGASGYRNLFLAGDWTRNGLNVGCIEATVISGRRAARGIIGDDRPLVGERDG